jgi:hypothetical protein
MRHALALKPHGKTTCLKCTEADFIEYRRQRTWTAWKYAMHDAGLPLPTQSSNGRARCFCGATIDIAVTHQHVFEVHV